MQTFLKYPSCFIFEQLIGLIGGKKDRQWTVLFFHVAAWTNHSWYYVSNCQTDNYLQVSFHFTHYIGCSKCKIWLMQTVALYPSIRIEEEEILLSEGESHPCAEGQPKAFLSPINFENFSGT